jgi:hypothetical protein
MQHYQFQVFSQRTLPPDVRATLTREFRIDTDRGDPEAHRTQRLCRGAIPPHYLTGALRAASLNQVVDQLCQPPGDRLRWDTIAITLFRSFSRWDPISPAP